MFELRGQVEEAVKGLRYPIETLNEEQIDILNADALLTALAEIFGGNETRR